MIDGAVPMVAINGFDVRDTRSVVMVTTPRREPRVVTASSPRLQVRLLLPDPRRARRQRAERQELGGVAVPLRAPVRDVQPLAGPAERAARNHVQGVPFFLFSGLI